ncbi:phage minor capsid protein [Promicromonospora iranensis]|uniref:Ribosomal protein L12E/L44/L45/RPP1/RPP2 n=1 Tax=Promicromonospora iranensis TaxID=1105144 RepID=A0ABU2CV50_9MICO|nr:phage minor capsid protein [Promicromonospora iranensis]MDR7385220.1 ribosomal protein L12E/L44/L45/RPP1/RPP2 [Promicromonospora iranensis]
MAQWIPDDRDGLDRLVAELVELFSSAERRLVAAVALQVRAGIEAGEDSPQRILNLGGLSVEATRIARWLRQTSPEVLDRVLATAQARGVTAAMAELSAVVGTTGTTTAAAVAPSTSVVAASALSGAGAAIAIRADLTNSLDDVVRRVLRFPDDVYRRAVAQFATDVPLGLGTTRTAQQGAWGRLLAQGVTGFVDKAGRRWNLASYVEMATRSATRRAYDDTKIATMQDHGIPLVSIVVGSGACERCARWSGKILRTDGGPTGRVRFPRANGDGEITVNVAATLDQAKRAGWRHPNCRCSTVAYLPGLSVIQDVTHYDPDAEAARQKLRHLERETRKAKIEVMAAVGDAEKKAANARVRAYQAKIRDHVAETGLIRQRNREQIDLGNVA